MDAKERRGTRRKFSPSAVTGMVTRRRSKRGATLVATEEQAGVRNVENAAWAKGKNCLLRRVAVPP